MESLNASACIMDDLLDFSSDIGEEDDDENPKNSLQNHLFFHQHCQPSFPLLPCRDDQSLPYPLVEEELEWISNKDAFPMVESLVDIMPNHPSIATSNNNDSMNNNISHNYEQSPISVLENSSSSFNSNVSHGSINNGNMMMLNLSYNFKVIGKARSKHVRKRRRNMLQCWSVYEKPSKKPGSSSVKSSSTVGRKCLHCGAEKTPQWRAGPLGPKTLCNACGVRYKSGRLCDEYRPASSPTFSSELHSNSHRKIVEMRKQKMVIGDSGLEPAEIG